MWKVRSTIFRRAGDTLHFRTSNRLHFPLSYFQFIHIGILTLNSYNRYGSPSAVLDMHPRRIGQDLLVGENPAMAQTFLNQFIRVQGKLPGEGFQVSQLDTPYSETVVERLGTICLGILRGRADEDWTP